MTAGPPGDLRRGGGAASCPAVFAPYLARWGLAADGAEIVTRAARLLPVRQGDTPFMLRIAIHPEAQGCHALLDWWEGDGAARLVAADGGDAILIERALGTRSLAAMARASDDDAATHILCDVIARLHAPRTRPIPDLIALAAWFEALWPAARTHGGLLARAAEAAQALLSEPVDVRPLHGDIHHDNVLDFGASRGWLAIDPNRLLGERGYDYANLFCNPDMETPETRVAVRPERFHARLAIVAARSGLERVRLLSWILAYAGLSAAWLLADGDSAAVDFQIASLADAELVRSRGF